MLVTNVCLFEFNMHPDIKTRYTLTRYGLTILKRAYRAVPKYLFRIIYSKHLKVLKPGCVLKFLIALT